MKPNMDWLRKTDDIPARIEMGKQAVKVHSDYYTEQTLAGLLNKVQSHSKLTDKAELMNCLYQSVYCYWAYGALVDEFFYFDFWHKTDEEIRPYITTREKVVYRNHLNRLEDAHLLNNKWESYNLFREYYGRDVILLKGSEDYPVFCDFIQKHPQFVVKPTDMGGGSGVHKVTVDTNMTEDEKHRLFLDILSEIKENQIRYMRGKEQSIILEELLVQVPEMARMHPNSINGVRVPTVRVGNEVHVVHPWLKFGRNGAFLTSAVYGTLDACIDVDTGVVFTQGYTENGEVFDRHPDTDVPIVGFQVPRWQDLLTTVRELAMKLDTIHYVGWDMVLTEKGWVMMEGNFSGDFMWQLCLGRGTKKEFEDLIGWKLTKDFWWQE